MSTRRYPSLAVASALALGLGTVPSASGEGQPTTLPPLLPGPPYTSLLAQPEPAGNVKLDGCFVSLITVPTTSAHARRYVPSRYQFSGAPGTELDGLADGNPTWKDDNTQLEIWDLACDYARVGKQDPAPMKLSVAGVLIAPSASAATANPFKETGAFPNIDTDYLFRAATDNKQVYDLLQRVGFPVELTPSFGYLSTAARTVATVNSPSNGYSFSVNAKFEDVVFGPHDHDNNFIFDRGGSGIDLSLKLTDARDEDCVFRGTDLECTGMISAPRSSSMYDFIGTGSYRSRSLVLRHHKVPFGSLSVGRPQ